MVGHSSLFSQLLSVVNRHQFERLDLFRRKLSEGDLSQTQGFTETRHWPHRVWHPPCPE